MIFRIIYLSTAVKEFDESEIEELLRVARRNNQQNGITGVLLYHDRNFFQVLEGEENLVLDCLESIRTDSRHRAVYVLYRGKVEHRLFENWSMGLVPLDRARQIISDAAFDLRSIEPEKYTSDPLTSTMIRIFLEAFRNLKLTHHLARAL